MCLVNVLVLDNDQAKKAKVINKLTLAFYGLLKLYALKTQCNNIAIKNNFAYYIQLSLSYFIFKS